MKTVCYKYLVLFAVIFLLNIILAPKVFASTLATDDFETGNYTNETGTRVSGTNSTLTVNTVSSQLGTYGSDALVNDTVNGTDQANTYKTFTPSTTGKTYWEFWFQYKSFTTGGAGVVGSKAIGMLSSGNGAVQFGDNSKIVWITGAGSASQRLQLVYTSRSGVDTLGGGSSVNLVVGSWYKIKVLVDTTGSNPVFTWWLSTDGVNYTLEATVTDTTSGTFGAAVAPNTVSQGIIFFNNFENTTFEAYYDSWGVYDSDPDAGSSHTLILQPSSAIANNTWIDQANVNTNESTEQHLYATLYSTGRILRSLIKFDLSSIPSGSTVTSATLNLYALATNTGPTINVHRILSSDSDWSASQATWTNRKTGTAWAGSPGCGTAGTDYASMVMGTFTSASLSTHTGTNISLDTNEVQSMITTNYGMLINAADETTVNSNQNLSSASSTNTSISPKLIINYTIPPNTPSSLGPNSVINGNFTNNTTPQFNFTLSDPNSSNTVKYQIQIDNNSDFSSPEVDYTSALATQGSASFTVGESPGSGSYTTGTQGQTLADGSYYWRVKTISSAGASSSYSTANSGSIAFKIDTTAPTIPGTPSTASAAADTTPIWTWTASTDSGSGVSSYTVEWSTDSSFSTGVSTDTSATSSYTHSTALADGTWYFRVKAKDAVGNFSSYSGSGSDTISTDSTAPTGSISINSGSGYTQNPAVTLTISASDVDNSASQISMEISENSSFSTSSWESYQTSKAWTFSSSDGVKTIYARFKDPNNNISTPYSGSITLDQTGPTGLTAIGPSQASYTNLDRPTFSWKAASDATSGISSYQVSIDNGGSGNFTIGNIPPSGDDYQTSTYVVTYNNFNDSDPTNNYISLYTKSAADWGNDQNDGKLKEGERSWTVTAYDSAGNSSSISNIFEADFSSPSLRNVSRQNSIISGTISDNLLPDKIELRVFKQNYFLGVLTSSTLDNTQIFNLDNPNSSKDVDFSLTAKLPINGSYKLQVTGLDKAGNRSASLDFNLQIPPASSSQEAVAPPSNPIISTSPTLQPTPVSENPQISLPSLEKQAILRHGQQASQFEQLIKELKITTTNFAQVLSSSLSSAKNGVAILASSLNNIQAPSLALNLTNSPINQTLTKILVKPFSKTNQNLNNFQQNVSQNISVAQKNTNQSFKNSLSFLARLNQSASLANQNSQENVKNYLKTTIQPTSNQINNIGPALNIAFHSFSQPVNDTSDILYRTKVWLLTFQSVVINPDPTVISHVTLEEVGADYAVVSWDTNHYAWGKVNYGEDLSYGQEVILSKMEKHHTARLTSLKPNVRYFFEVMSQDGNYTYDAYYSFVTKSN